MTSLYIPKDAFIVKNAQSTLSQAKIGNYTETRYNNYIVGLTGAGYSMEDAKLEADTNLQEYFDLYMSKYYGVKKEEEIIR